jgi:hypothetical protein
MQGGTQKLTREEITRAIEGGTLKLSRAEIERTMQGGTQQLSREELAHVFQGGTQRLSREEIERAIEGGTVRLSREELDHAFQGGTQRLSRQEIQAALRNQPPARTAIPREAYLYAREAGGELRGNYHPNAVSAAERLHEWNVAQGTRPVTPESLREFTREMHRIIADGPQGQRPYPGFKGQPGRMREPHPVSPDISKGAMRPPASQYVSSVIADFPDQAIVRPPGEGITPLPIAGISERALPGNVIAAGGHAYPRAQYLDEYFRRGAELLNEIRSAPAGSTQAFEKTAEYYHLMINAQPFDQINNSLFMTQVNYLLRAKEVHPGMTQGYLDYFAYELQFPEFLKIFRLHSEGRLPAPSVYGLKP